MRHYVFTVGKLTADCAIDKTADCTTDVFIAKHVASVAHNAVVGDVTQCNADDTAHEFLICFFKVAMTNLTVVDKFCVFRD